MAGRLAVHYRTLFQVHMCPPLSLLLRLQGLRLPPRHPPVHDPGKAQPAPQEGSPLRRAHACVRVPARLLRRHPNTCAHAPSLQAPFCSLLHMNLRSAPSHLR